MFWDPSWNTPATSTGYTGDNGCDRSNPGGVVTYTQAHSDGYAVTCVNWAQAAAFCAWDNHKRLPTATEWYYVATGAGLHATEFPWGGASPDCTQATFGDCPYPVHVATTAVQIHDMYDLIGGVSEWAWDAVDPSSLVWFPPDATDYTGWAFDGGGGLAARNSFWINSSYTMGALALDSVGTAGPMAEYGYPDVGFRCAQTQ
jgi:formylglycine-generating enzyme required for sulfatase activity